MKPHLVKGKLELLLLISGGGRWPPDHVWDDVGRSVRWRWCSPAGGHGGEGQQREWRLWRKGVKVDLKWGQVAKQWKACQELSDLEGCRPHIPLGQVCGMTCAAKEMGHRVVGWSGSRAGGVIGPDYGVTVGQEPRAMAGTALWEGALVWPW